MMGAPTNRRGELRIKRNVRYLMEKAADGDASAMEELGKDFFRRVYQKLAENNGDTSEVENDDINIFEGVFSALYWFDKAVAYGKTDANYWIGETIDLEFSCRGSSSAYYRSFFLEGISRFSQGSIFKETMENKKGYLYQVLNHRGIFPFDNILFYIKAANCGDSSAAYRLGEIYLMRWFAACKSFIACPDEEPRPCDEDLLEAKKYLEYASQNGEREAFFLIFDVMQELEKAAVR